MVNYENPDLFYEHETTHLIIVNSEATVTGRANTTPLIEDDTFCLTEDNITEEEFEVRESLCSRDNLKFGTMEASMFRVDIFDNEDIPYLKDEEIDVYIYFNDDSSNIFKVGRYIVNEDIFSDDRLTRSITAYDLINYLRDYDITDWYIAVYEGANTRTIKYLRDSLFAWLTTDIEDYNIEQEETDLINDDWEVEKSIGSDVVTFGFFMQGIAEFNGVFPHINREGVFCYVSLAKYSADPVKTFGDELIVPPVKYGGAGKDITVWGIGYVIVYDQNNKRLAKVGSSSKKYPSNYKIIDSFVCTNYSKRSGWKTALKAALALLREQITALRYKPFEGGFYGNLCLEVGDRIDVDIDTYDEETDGVDDDEPIVKHFYTYILERNFIGLNDFDDTYYAKGDKKQPKYKVKQNSNWHITDSDSGASGAGSVTDVDDEFKKRFVKAIRNIGIRLLSEPSNVSLEYDATNKKVLIKWTDPADITTNRPVPANWAGTIVVRKEDEAPWFRWDSTEVIVNSTTRDEYSETAFEDDTIEYDKHYYYGIFPYDTEAHYRFTKVISVDTDKPVLAPDLKQLICSETTVQVKYSIPADYTWDYVKLVYKKNGIPTSITDGTAVDITGTSTLIRHLEEVSRYYFIIFAKEHDTGKVVNSDVLDITTQRNTVILAFTETIGIIEGDISTITEETITK